MHKLLLVILLCGISACNNYEYDDDGKGDTRCPTCPSPNPPTPQPPNVGANSIEFRVNGTPNATRIRFSNTTDGTTQVITSVPYSIVVTTNQNSLFISLDATPLSFPIDDFPFLVVQIFVNGVLFREAVSSDATYMSTITVSGTWRR